MQNTNTILNFSTAPKNILWLPKPRRIYIRHGFSFANQEGDPWYINEDSALFNMDDHQVPLVELGKRQVTGVGFFVGDLVGHKADVIIDSGLLRAIQSRELILEAGFDPRFPIEKISMALVRERLSGSLRKSTAEQRSQISYLNLIEQQFVDDPVHAQPIGGEALVSVVDRLLTYELFLWLTYPGKVVLTVCHGNVIRAREMLHYMQTRNFSLEQANEYLKSYFPGNCTVHEYNQEKQNGKDVLTKHHPIEPPYNSGTGCW